jgi:nucleotide-binding universal stress UspA family protein
LACRIGCPTDNSFVFDFAQSDISLDDLVFIRQLEPVFMFTNILVPVDGSTHSYRASEVAGELATKFGAQITLLYVVNAGAASGVPEELRDLARIEHIELSEWNWLEGVANKILETADGWARKSGAKNIQTVVDQGEPAQAIIDYSKNHHADLIVMGRRGLGSAAGLLMGSVSHKVAHLVECPCMTVI